MNYKYTKDEWAVLYNDLNNYIEDLKSCRGSLKTPSHLSQYHFNIAIARGIMDLFLIKYPQNRSAIKVINRACIPSKLKRDVGNTMLLSSKSFYNRLNCSSKCSIVTGMKKYSKIRINKLRDFLYNMPLDEMPLYISDHNPFSVIAIWRLKIDK